MTDHVDPRIERTRAAILHAAEELLMEAGPDAVTHANVAERANVSRTTVYTHHPTREDLLRATVEARRPNILIELTGDLRSDLLAGLTGLAKDLGDEQRKRIFTTVLERSHHDPAMATVRRESVGSASMLFKGLLQRAVEEGNLRSDLDTDLAIASLIGIFFFKRFLLDESVPPEAVEKIVDDFLSTNAPR